MKNLLRRSAKQQPRTAATGNLLAHSVEPVIVRDLHGNIVSWNRAAERNYGWSKSEAVGNVSHNLLETIFPMALDQINDELLSNGQWRGELIHTLSDGTRVRVRSRWELVAQDDSTAAEVVETNNYFEQLKPESAHFTGPSLGLRLVGLFRDRRSWLLLMLASILAIQLYWEMSNNVTAFQVF